jgi:hypothetical protein
VPLGLDAEFRRQMDYGIEWMNARSGWLGKSNKLTSAIGTKRTLPPC